MRKNRRIWIACATPKLTMLNNPITMPIADIRTIRQARSMSQAAKRVRGPASNWEKTMPSGVLISNVLVLLMSGQLILILILILILLILLLILLLTLLLISPSAP